MHDTFVGFQTKDNEKRQNIEAMTTRWISVTLASDASTIGVFRFLMKTTSAIKARVTPTPFKTKAIFNDK